MFLGVDGGGTKTAFCLVDSTGTVRAEALGDGAYYFAENGSGGVEHVVRVLEKGIAEVCAKAGITTDGIDHAFLGLPGYGEAPVTSPRSTRPPPRSSATTATPATTT